MTELNVNQLENLEGGKFWGRTDYDTFRLGNKCYRNTRYQAFWITTSFKTEEVAC